MLPLPQKIQHIGIRPEIFFIYPVAVRAFQHNRHPAFFHDPDNFSVSSGERIFSYRTFPSISTWFPHAATIPSKPIPSSRLSFILLRDLPLHRNVLCPFFCNCLMVGIVLSGICIFSSHSVPSISKICMPFYSPHLSAVSPILA